jgi:ketosteroid isomerase-like protein
MHANAEIRWAIISAIDTLIDHIANGRHRETLACFTGDPDCALLGSEEGEAAIGPEALRTFFADLYARPDRLLFTLPERRISAHGNVAWIAGEGTYRLSSGGGERPFRLTGVLERRAGRWLWQQFASSEPAPGDEPPVS